MPSARFSGSRVVCRHTETHIYSFSCLGLFLFHRPSARTTGAPQNHWFGPGADSRAAGIGTREAIRVVWSCHRYQRKLKKTSVVPYRTRLLLFCFVLYSIMPSVWCGRAPRFGCSSHVQHAFYSLWIRSISSGAIRMAWSYHRG